MPDVGDYVVEIIRKGFVKQKYRARVVAFNGKIIAWTESYHNKADVLRIVGRVFPTLLVRDEA